MEFAGAGAVVVEGEVAEALRAVGVEQLEVAVDVWWRAVSSRRTEVAGVSSMVRTSPASETTVRKWRSMACWCRRRLWRAVLRSSTESRRPVMVGAGGVDLDARAADGGVEVGGGGVFAEGEGEGFELLLERRGGVVAGAGDAAAVEVDGGEGLEDVVELGGGEVDGDVGVAGDVAGVLEEADAVFVERDAGDGERRGLVRRGVLAAGLVT